MPGAELFLTNLSLWEEATCPGQLRCLGQNFLEWASRTGWAPLLLEGCAAPEWPLLVSGEAASDACGGSSRALPNLAPWSLSLLGTYGARYIVHAEFVQCHRIGTARRGARAFCVACRRRTCYADNVATSTELGSYIAPELGSYVAT